MIEVVVSLAVVVVLAIALVTTTLVTQRSSRAAKNNTQATKLAQQNIEQVRVLRDRQGFNLLSNGCYTLSTSGDPSSWALSSINCLNLGEPVVADNIIFNRKISIADGSNSNEKKIIITVSWTDSGGPRQVVDTTNLSKCVQSNVTC